MYDRKEERFREREKETRFFFLLQILGPVKEVTRHAKLGCLVCDEWVI